MINGNKILQYISGIFFSNKVKTKVQRGNGFWTFLKMSIFEKPEKVLKKGVFLSLLEHNGLKHRKKTYNFVTIKKQHFSGKNNLGIFY